MAAHNLVERAIDIITYLAEHAEGRSVTAIAEGLHMPASAAHRLLASLSNKGVVEQDQRTRDYVLTLALPALGLRYLSGLSFMDVCRPVMDRLARETRELVRLAVVSGHDLVWIAKAQGSKSSLRLDPLEGRAALPHVTAAGKAWLASMPNEVAAKRCAALMRMKNPPLGPNAHTRVETLLADIETSRRQGFAVTYEEAEPGVAAVGAVIRAGSSVDQPVVATISVAGPTARIERKDIEPIASKVTEAATQLSALWPPTQGLADRPAAVPLKKAPHRT